LSKSASRARRKGHSVDRAATAAADAIKLLGLRNIDGIKLRFFMDSLEHPKVVFRMPSILYKLPKGDDREQSRESGERIRKSSDCENGGGRNPRGKSQA
jgi:hypothetical protein